MHDRVVVLCGDFIHTLPSGGGVAIEQHHFCAQGLGVLDLDLGRGHGYHQHRLDAQHAGGIGQPLGVVA
ncbi:hypothetical protein D9M69_662920 [compost metagenome]